VRGGYRLGRVHVRESTGERRVQVREGQELLIQLRDHLQVVLTPLGKVVVIWFLVDGPKLN